MASALSFGAGAAEGLDVLLSRMMAEHRMQQEQERINEAQRSNMAREGIQRDQLSSLDRDRQAREAETAGYHKVIGDARTDANVRQETSMRPIGGMVTPEEKKLETSHGIPDALYGGWQPGNMGMSTPEKEVGPTNEGMPWMGTQDQIQRSKTKPGSDYNKEVKTVIYQGKPVDANYDPRGLTYTLPSGEDITSEVQHYEKPPSPDRVLIQTGDSYMRRSDAAGQLAGGGNVPLATTSTTRTMSEGASMLQPHIKEVTDDAQRLNEAGLFGPVMSRVRQVLTQAGTIDQFALMLGEDPELNRDKLTGRFVMELGLLATGGGRVHGGARGGSSTEMMKYMKGLLSDVGTIDMFQGRMEGFDRYMSGYAAGPKPVTPGAAAPQGDPNDPLNILRR